MIAQADTTQLELIGRPIPPPANEPQRALCPHCLHPVLTIEIKGRRIVASIYEWEPRAACQSCLHTRRAHPTSFVNCGRCADTGYVGTQRPAGWLLAIDMGWGDEQHARVIGPRTDRRTGEAVYVLHVCGQDEWR